MKETTVGVSILAGALLALMWGPYGLLLFGVSAIAGEVRYRRKTLRNVRRTTNA